jgi:hypothetical protein
LKSPGNHPQSVQKPAELVGGPYDGCRVKLGEDYPYVLIIGRYAYAITDDLRYECMGPDSALPVDGYKIIEED